MSSFAYSHLSAFHESSRHVADVNWSCNRGSSSDPISSHSDVSVPAGALALVLDNVNDSTYETSEIDPAVYMKKNNHSEFSKGNSYDALARLTEATVNKALSENDNAALSNELSERKEEKLFDGRINLDKINLDAEHLLRESPLKDTRSATPNEISNLWEVHQDSRTSSKCSGSVEASEAMDTLASTDLQLLHDKLVVLPMDEQQKINRLLNTLQQRLVTSKTDVEDLIARLNQELAVRQYLATKVKDLETELESTKKSGKENLEQAILIERERLTQVQWDTEELRRKSMEMELRLKAEQDEKALAEATKTSIIKENEALRQELDLAREQLKNLQKCHEETELKSKNDVKLLVREIKSLRSSQSELRQELDRLAQEKTEFETRLQRESTKREHVNAANAKLLHEFEILRRQLEECSVNFLFEQENKLKTDAWSPTDALDLLATSENRIGLLLAEAQLVARDTSTPLMILSHESDNVTTVDDKLRKMLTDVFIDNAILRKQVNSVIQCALNMIDESPNSPQTAKEDGPSRKTVTIDQVLRNMM
ncbi:hypothetical protein CDL12_20570 [Handroanthus impetiginosus]|uniref:Uncharacterized protein n=1 Tax=Handroanthus impetiginosus TaxID=429701 RepID=A0A2G9GNS7_9LAMI|nr:hypothetical protein CDL12_20570 [Handroanthus impetiginosus]